MKKQKLRPDDFKKIHNLSNRLAREYPNEKFPMPVLRMLDHLTAAETTSPAELGQIRSFCKEVKKLQDNGFSQIEIKSVVQRDPNGHFWETISEIAGTPEDLSGIQAVR